LTVPDSANVRIYPAAVFAVCLFGGVTAEMWLHLAPLPIPQPLGQIAGLAVCFAGLALVVIGLAGFVSHGVNPMPARPASSLVSGGVYRLSRNPMYAGMVAILLGTGIAAAGKAILIGAVVLFAFLNWYVIPREEKYLTRTFGEDYLDYCRRVRRWI
jgi:protein-S-isoprenylcysteine O-methyltransferase Ste14